MLLPKSTACRSSTASAFLLDLSPSPSPTTANSRGGRRRWSASFVNSSRNGTDGGGFSDDGDGDGNLTDSDHDDSTAVGVAAAAAAAGSGLVLRRRQSVPAGGELVAGGAATGHAIEDGLGHGYGGYGSDAVKLDDGDDEDDEEGTCDIFLEAVSTGGLQEELLGHHAFEVRTYRSFARARLAPAETCCCC